MQQVVLAHLELVQAEMAQDLGDDQRSRDDDRSSVGVQSADLPELGDRQRTERLAPRSSIQALPSRCP